jgi:hypothetical protein
MNMIRKGQVRWVSGNDVWIPDSVHRKVVRAGRSIRSQHGRYCCALLGTGRCDDVRDAVLAAICQRECSITVACSRSSVICNGGKFSFWPSAWAKNAGSSLALSDRSPAN